MLRKWRVLRGVESLVLNSGNVSCITCLRKTITKTWVCFKTWVLLSDLNVSNWNGNPEYTGKLAPLWNPRCMCTWICIVTCARCVCVCVGVRFVYSIHWPGARDCRERGRDCSYTHSHTVIIYGTLLANWHSSIWYGEKVGKLAYPKNLGACCVFSPCAQYALLNLVAHVLNRKSRKQTTKTTTTVLHPAASLSRIRSDSTWYMVVRGFSGHCW